MAQPYKHYRLKPGISFLVYFGSKILVEKLKCTERGRRERKGRRGGGIQTLCERKLQMVTPLR